MFIKRSINIVLCFPRVLCVDELLCSDLDAMISTVSGRASMQKARRIADEFLKPDRILLFPAKAVLLEDNGR